MEAKIRAVPILNMFRKNSILAYHALHKEKFSNQLSHAENLHIPYTAIMGYKEACENTIVFRNTETRAQEIVPMADLPMYLKKLSKKVAH
jgi:histidyl-tRNA synthetase